MITAVNLQKTSHSKAPDYVEIYSRMQDFIERVNEKIVNRIQIVKHTYLDEYKEHMKIMSTQLKDIKEQIDEARLKERANQKMFLLEEERDYFRFQVSKLDGEVRKLQADIKNLKKALADSRDEIKNYKHICFKLEENSSKLKSEVLEIYSAKQSELQMVTIPMTDRKSSERNVKTAVMPRVRSSSGRQFVLQLKEVENSPASSNGHLDDKPKRPAAGSTHLAAGDPGRMHQGNEEGDLLSKPQGGIAGHQVLLIGKADTVREVQQVRPQIAAIPVSGKRINLIEVLQVRIRAHRQIAHHRLRSQTLRRQVQPREPATAKEEVRVAHKIYQKPQQQLPSRERYPTSAATLTTTENLLECHGSHCSNRNSPDGNRRSGLSSDRHTFRLMSKILGITKLPVFRLDLLRVFTSSCSFFMRVIRILYSSCLPAVSVEVEQLQLAAFLKFKAEPELAYGRSISQDSDISTQPTCRSQEGMQGRSTISLQRLRSRPRELRFWRDWCLDCPRCSSLMFYLMFLMASVGQWLLWSGLRWELLLMLSPAWEMETRW